MPDENKLQALADAQFQVKKTCFRCDHFLEGAGGWGACLQITYEHKKHTPTAAPRPASVPLDGWCPQHDPTPEALAHLSAHIRFLEIGSSS